MVWQSWGHSGSTPAPGELDFGATSLRDSYLGNRFLDWMNHYVRGTSSAPTGPQFSLLPRLGALRHPARPTPARRSRRRTPSSDVLARPDRTRSTSPAATRSTATPPSVVRPAPRPTPTPGRRPTSYSETSGLEGSHGEQPAERRPRHLRGVHQPAADGTRRPGRLPEAARCTCPPRSPRSTQASGPGGKLVLFAKVYDVAPDGTKTLQNRLISPVRVADVTKPVT